LSQAESLATMNGMKSSSTIISLASILAILACPLWCAAGVCHDAGCCIGNNESHALLQNETCGDCCASSEKLHEQDGNDSKSVPAAPDESDCQGICGGAILVDQIVSGELNSSFSLHFESTVEFLDTFGLTSTNEFEVPLERPQNFGRFLCALHSSYQC